MRYNLTNTFTQINETSGVFYNFGQSPVEIATTTTNNSGLILLSGQRQQFNTEGNIYARSLEQTAILNVVPLI